jgi:hypothetical protein
MVTQLFVDCWWRDQSIRNGERGSTPPSLLHPNDANKHTHLSMQPSWLNTCVLSFPFHDHDGGEKWASPWQKAEQKFRTKPAASTGTKASASFRALERAVGSYAL